MLRRLARWPFVSLWIATPVLLVLSLALHSEPLGLFVLPYFWLRGLLGWALQVVGADTPAGPFDLVFFLPLYTLACVQLDNLIFRLRGSPQSPAANSAAPRWPHFSEPWSSALKRTVTMATVIGVVVSLVRRDPASAPRIVVMASVFTVGGHVMELWWLNSLRHKVGGGRVRQAALRVGFWAWAGMFLFSTLFFVRLLRLDQMNFYERASVRGFFSGSPYIAFFFPWIAAGIGFVLIELTVHAGLMLRGLPSFYDGRA